MGSGAFLPAMRQDCIAEQWIIFVRFAEFDAMSLQRLPIVALSGQAIGVHEFTLTASPPEFRSRPNATTIPTSGSALT